MPQFGRKLYFDKLTGDIIIHIPESDIETTIEKDFETYPPLASKGMDYIGVVQLEVGQYQIDFNECSGFKVNKGTLQVEFMYPNQPIEQNQSLTSPLTSEVNEIKQKIKTPLEIYNETDKSTLTLDELKQLKLDALSYQCRHSIMYDFTSSNGHIFRLELEDQLNIQGQKDELDNDPAIETISWRTMDMGYLDFSREEFYQVYREAYAHKRTNLLRLESLRQDVNAILDENGKDTIMTITW